MRKPKTTSRKKMIKRYKKMIQKAEKGTADKHAQSHLPEMQIKTSKRLLFTYRSAEIIV